MVGSGPLNSENITGLLKNLDKALDEAGGRAELYLAGGARMLFGWRTDRHTSDLDGVMRTGQTRLMTTAMRISGQHGLEPTWVNPAVTYFVPTKPDPGETTLYKGKALTVKGASIEHMLAMKIRGHRDIDLDDAEVLIRRLKLTDTGSIQQIAEDAYEEHGADDTNKKMILEGLKRLVKTTMPNLTVNHRAGGREREVETATLQQTDPNPDSKNRQMAPPPYFQPPSAELLSGGDIDHSADTHATRGKTGPTGGVPKPQHPSTSTPRKSKKDKLGEYDR